MKARTKTAKKPTPMREFIMGFAADNLNALDRDLVDALFEIGWSGEKVLSFIIQNVALAEDKWHPST